MHTCTSSIYIENIHYSRLKKRKKLNVKNCSIISILIWHELFESTAISNNRKEHFNEATKGQHIGPNNFANGKHGYSRVVAGAISVD